MFANEPLAVFPSGKNVSGGGFFAAGRLDARWHRTVPARKESRVFESLWRSICHRSRSHDAVICVYDDAGNVSSTHEKGDFKEP